MNRAERIVRRVDGIQQRSTPVGFVFAVVKKFGDDRAGSLAALIAYYGFLAVFPLFLLLVTVLGFALHRYPSWQTRVVDSALGDFPIVGDQIRSNVQSIRASGLGLAIGLFGLLWGALGVTQAAQFAMAQIWNVKGSERPGYLPRLARGLGFLASIAVGLAVTTSVAELVAAGGGAAWLDVAGFVAGAAANGALYLVAFRLLTPRVVATRELVPGAVLGGVAWTALQLLGTALVANRLQGSSQLYGLFAIVLGLLWWLFLAAQLSLYAAEVNVVWARRLWPRSIVPPPLTESDQTVLRDIAEQATRRPEERVVVTFDDTGTAGAPSEPGRGPR